MADHRSLLKQRQSLILILIQTAAPGRWGGRGKPLREYGVSACDGNPAIAVKTCHLPASIAEKPHLALQNAVRLARCNGNGQGGAGRNAFARAIRRGKGHSAQVRAASRSAVVL